MTTMNNFANNVTFDDMIDSLKYTLLSLCVIVEYFSFAIVTMDGMKNQTLNLTHVNCEYFFILSKNIVI